MYVLQDVSQEIVGSDWARIMKIPDHCDLIFSRMTQDLPAHVPKALGEINRSPS